MKTVIINTLAKEKSTGKITYGFYKYLIENDVDTYVAYGQPPVYHEKNFYRIGGFWWSELHKLFSRLFGNPGCYSTIPTLKFIYKLKMIKPDAVYLFNIHGYYLNEYLLLFYLKKAKIRTIYIMLDEYAFMGKCGFSMGCNEYIKGCKNCKYKRRYPASWFINSSHRMAEKKKVAYDDFEGLTFVATPYTLSIAAKSYILCGKETYPADEAIDINKYYPRNPNHLRKELGIDEKNIIIMCVARYPDERKGGQYFLEAAKRLSNETSISFVHVGYSAGKKQCPPNYIPVNFIADQDKLCEYYSLADLFCFPSLCETLPSTCLEALACGSPLLLFNISGMPYIGDETCSQLVEPADVDSLVDVIKRTPQKTNKTIEICRNYAIKRYDNKLYYSRLLDLAKSNLPND